MSFLQANGRFGIFSCARQVGGVKAAARVGVRILYLVGNAAPLASETAGSAPNPRMGGPAALWRRTPQTMLSGLAKTVFSVSSPTQFDGIRRGAGAVMNQAVRHGGHEDSAAGPGRGLRRW